MPTRALPRTHEKCFQSIVTRVTQGEDLDVILVRPSRHQPVARLPRSVLAHRSVLRTRPCPDAVFDAKRFAHAMHMSGLAGCFRAQAVIHGDSKTRDARLGCVISRQHQQGQGVGSAGNGDAEAGMLVGKNPERVHRPL